MAKREFKIGDDISCIFEAIGVENKHTIYSIDILGTGYMYNDMINDVHEIGGSGDYATYTVLMGYVKQTDVIIPVGIKNIGDHAFPSIGSAIWAGTSSLSGVQNIYIGEDVEFIGEGAFRKTYTGGGIWNVILTGNNPKLRWIKKEAFMNQSNMLKCNFRGLVDTLGNSAFRDCNKLETLNLSDNYYYDADYFNDNEHYVFYNCYKLKHISENNVVVDINSTNGTSNYNYRYCDNLDYITINNPIDANPSISDKYRNGLGLKAGLWGTDFSNNPIPGLDVEFDIDGNIITKINTEFEEYFDNRYILWKENMCRNIVQVSNFKVYVYHMGKIIKLKGGNSGNIPVLHEGQWKWLNVVKDSENPSYSPIHFTHNGQWYQFKY